MTTTNVTSAYAPQFKAWQVKAMGSKPTAELLTTAHHFGRVGKQSLALAMAMRPEGVTASQIVMVCGAPQNNHRRDVIAAGWFKRDMNAGQNDLGHTVYKITLTAKGEGEIKKRTNAQANATATPAKLTGKVGATKGKAKAKAAPPATAPEAATDAVSVATPATPAPSTENVPAGN